MTGWSVMVARTAERDLTEAVLYIKDRLGCASLCFTMDSGHFSGHILDIIWTSSYYVQKINLVQVSDVSNGRRLYETDANDGPGVRPPRSGALSIVSSHAMALFHGSVKARGKLIEASGSAAGRAWTPKRDIVSRSSCSARHQTGCPAF